MKKQVLMITMAAAMLAIAACGKKADTAASSAAASSEAQASSEEAASSKAADEAASNAAASEAQSAANNADSNTDADAEELYFEGVVQSMTKSQITVTSDEGQTAVFDISKAERDPDTELLPTAYVEVTYTGTASSTTPAPASYVAVMMSIEEQASELGVDPVLYGTITLIDQNDLIINDLNGVEHTFNNSISHTVTFSQAKIGSEVAVTYAGTLEKDVQEDSADGSGAGQPLAIKIVTSDAFSSSQAKENYIKGSVNSVQDGTLLVDTIAETFEFTGEASLFANLQEDQQVTVYYNGALSNRTAVATRVTAG